jgi:type I restriction enzyme S subunit
LAQGSFRRICWEGWRRRRRFPVHPLQRSRPQQSSADLLGLCDRLEASLTATAITRRRLLDPLLAEPLAPVDDHDIVIDASPDARPVPTFAGDTARATK